MTMNPGFKLLSDGVNDNVMYVDSMSPEYENRRSDSKALKCKPMYASKKSLGRGFVDFVANWH